jgi:hypothetical protein
MLAGSDSGAEFAQQLGFLDSWHSPPIALRSLCRRDRSGRIRSTAVRDGTEQF